MKKTTNSKKIIKKSTNFDNFPNSFKPQNSSKLEKEEKTIKSYFIDFYKSYKILINTLIILFLVLFLAISIINLSYNLYSHKSPKISIEPTQVYKTLKNNESEVINFTASSQSNFLCNSICTYEFIDRSTSNVLKNGTLLKTGFINATISGPNIGSGILVYNLEVSCVNKKSLFCPYDKNQSVSKKSSFVVLSYDLTEDEKSIKEEVRPELLKLLLNLNQVNSKVDNFNIFLQNESVVFFDKKRLIDDFKIIENNIQKINYNAQKYYNFWENEEYNQISNKKLIENNEKLEIYTAQILDKEKEINLSINLGIELANRYNQDITDLENFTINKAETLKLFSLPSRVQLIFENISIKTQNLNSSFSSILNVSYEISEKQFDDFENEVQMFKFEVSKFNKNINDLKNETITLENEKRCNIGFCFDNTIKLIDNFCFNFGQLLNNNSYTNYSFTDEIYFYNNSYYDKAGKLEICKLDQNITCKFNESTYLKFKNDSFSEMINFEDEDVIILDEEIYTITQNKIQVLITENLSKNYFNLCSISSEKNKFNLSNFSRINYTKFNFQEINLSNQSRFNPELIEHLPKCCLNGVCTSCCVSDECKNNEKTYPLILVHGHSFLRNSPADPVSDMFNKIQYQLILDGYIDGGTLEFEAQGYNKDWSYLNLPLVLKTNYYYETYYDVGSYVYIVKSDESIDNYAIRFSENINNVKKMTGRPKVNIVAHSMGGLVTRRYMQIFGTDSINKVILIGTPNKGVEGRVEALCSVVGEKLECEDMKKNSILMSKLNDPNYIPKNVEIYTISGSGCETSNKDGDGIVTLNSSMLPYSKASYIINGTCPDLLKTQLHAKLLDIDIYPQVYENILEILNE